MTQIDELIAQARKLDAKDNSEILSVLDELSRSTAAWAETRFQMAIVRAVHEIAASRTLVPALADALEAAQKEIAGLSNDYDEANRAYHEWFETAQREKSRAEQAESELLEMRELMNIMPLCKGCEGKKDGYRTDKCDFYNGGKRCVQQCLKIIDDLEKLEKYREERSENDG